MPNLADSVGLKVICPSCGLENDVTLSQIRVSQDSSVECACRGESECPPFHLAKLLASADIDELVAAWKRLEGQAMDLGGRLEIIPQRS